MAEKKEPTNLMPAEPNKKKPLSKILTEHLTLIFHHLEFVAIVWLINQCLLYAAKLVSVCDVLLFVRRNLLNSWSFQVITGYCVKVKCDT